MVSVMAKAHVIVDADGTISNYVLLESASDWHDKTQIAHPYDGLWRHGWKWNGTEAVDPDPPKLVKPKKAGRVIA